MNTSSKKCKGRLAIKTFEAYLTWTVDSKIILMIWNFRCRLHTKSSHCAKYEQSSSIALWVVSQIWSTYGPEIWVQCPLVICNLLCHLHTHKTIKVRTYIWPLPLTPILYCQSEKSVVIYTTKTSIVLDMDNLHQDQVIDHNYIWPWRLTPRSCWLSETFIVIYTPKAMAVQIWSLHQKMKEEFALILVESQICTLFDPDLWLQGHFGETFVVICTLKQPLWSIWTPSIEKMNRMTDFKYFYTWPWS